MHGLNCEWTASRNYFWRNVLSLVWPNWWQSPLPRPSTPSALNVSASRGWGLGGWSLHALLYLKFKHWARVTAIAVVVILVPWKSYWPRVMRRTKSRSEDGHYILYFISNYFQTGARYALSVLCVIRSYYLDDCFILSRELKFVDCLELHENLQPSGSLKIYRLCSGWMCVTVLQRMAATRHGMPLPTAQCAVITQDGTLIS